MKKNLVEVLLKNINLSGLAVDMLDEVLEESLRKVVEDSENKWDDSIMELYPLIEPKLKELVEEQVKKLIDKINEAVEEDAPAE